MKFEDLNAWQKARELTNAVYDICKQGELARDYGLRGQLQRAAVSSMNNLAEGFERIHKKEKIQLYQVAKASAGEVKSMSYLIQDQQLVSQDEASKILQLATDVSALTQGLIKSTKE